MTCSQWLNVIGLILDLIGAGFLVGALFFSKVRIMELMELKVFQQTRRWWWPKLAGWTRINDGLTFTERVRQHKNAVIAAPFLAIGYILQILGNVFA